VLIPFEALGSDMYLVESKWYLSNPGALVRANAVAPAPSQVAGVQEGVPHPPRVAAAAVVDGPPVVLAPPGPDAAIRSPLSSVPGTPAPPLNVAGSQSSSISGADEPMGLASESSWVPAGLERSRQIRSTVPWTPSWWMPGAIDNRLYSLAVLRSRWADNQGRSTLDREVMPASAGQFMEYSPRLVTLAFLSPFPWQWSEDGSLASTSMMRRAVGAEMLVVSVAWLGLALNLWRWRARLELWLVLIYAGVATLAMAFTIPNIGSLHRARYGFLMVLVALGIAGAVSLLSSKRSAEIVPAH
jgi:hypothetical protein